jgi:hypothetical protein
LVLIFDRGFIQPQGHSAAGKIKSMKNLIDSMGNRTLLQRNASVNCVTAYPIRLMNFDKFLDRAMPLPAGTILHLTMMKLI